MTHRSVPYVGRPFFQSNWMMVLLAVFLPCMESRGTEAGKFNPDVAIGDPGQAWEKLPGVDDQVHSMTDLADREVLVVIFTCNSCPYAVDYEDRINRLAKKYHSVDSKVGIVAINVNRIEADQLPAMKKRAREKDFHFPYLYDETQKIAKAYGAVRTPEFFILNKERKIVYMGAMDDHSNESLVKNRYLETAIDSLLNGKEITVRETAPVGCRIRYASDRR